MTFTPRATAGVRLFTDLSIAAQSELPKDRLPFSHCFTIVASKKPLWGQCLFSSSGSLPARCLVLAQVWAYQRQSSSVMLPNHFDTHLACSSEARYEYSQCCHGPVRGALEGMKITHRLFLSSRFGEANVKRWPKRLKHFTDPRGFCRWCFHVRFLGLLIFALMERNPKGAEAILVKMG